MQRVRSRSLGWLTALLAALLLTPVATVFAQEGSPSATGEPIRSQTRQEFRAELEESLGYEEAQQEGGTFIDAEVADIQSLNPFLAEEAATLGIIGLIFDQLVGGDVRTGQPAPTGLADWWEIAPDGVTYTFHLNQDATWHDGVDVTAADVQFSFDALANEATGSVYTGSFVDAVASYRVIDDDTFEVVAKEPLYTFLYDLVTWIVPKHIWEEIPPEEWRTDPASTGQDPSRVIGSGPFKFQEWVQGESVTLVRNDDYYDKVPYIDTYVLRIWPDQIAVVNALLNNEIDVAGLEPADVATVEDTEGIEVFTFDTRGFTYIEFNLDPEVTTLFQDQAVRQALFYALDRQAIVDDILLGYAEVAQGTQPVISYAYAPEAITTTYSYDPELASQLLTEAGWTDTNDDGTVDKDGQELAFEYLYPAGSPTSDQIAAYLQDAWSEIGVAMTPRALEFPALIEATTTNPTFAVAAYGFGWDATFIQDAMFGCAQYQVGFNDMKYCNPELDEINAQAKTEFDQEQRRDLLIEASNIVNEELPVMVLHFSQGIVAHNTRVHNYIPSTWGIQLNYVWLEQ